MVRFKKRLVLNTTHESCVIPLFHLLAELVVYHTPIAGIYWWKFHLKTAKSMTEFLAD